MVFLLAMPKKAEVDSFEQILMVFRCLRPLRIYSLVPHMRRVVYEIVRGFKEILLVRQKSFHFCVYVLLLADIFSSNSKVALVANRHFDFVYISCTTCFTLHLISEPIFLDMISLQYLYLLKSGLIDEHKRLKLALFMKTLFLVCIIN